MDELVEVRRGDGIDAIHYGAIAVVDEFGRVQFSYGDIFQSFFMRSSAKPFQAMVVIESGAFEHYHFSLKELAVMCGSHGGSDEHVEVVRGILDKIGLDESYLRCGIHRPIDRRANKRLYEVGKSPTPLMHNCSGKHSGMLAVAKFNRWNLGDYWMPDHPVQVLAKKMVARYASVNEDAIATGVDGCSVVTFSLPLWRYGYMYARLSVDDGKPASLVREAMLRYPEMVSYSGSFTTELIRVGKSRFIAKSGAEGLFTMAVPDRKVGIVVKIYDGSSRAISVVVVEVLKQLGLIDDDMLSALVGYADVKIYNHRGMNVGEMMPVFRLRRA